MTGNITKSYQGKTAKNTVIEDVEYDVYELTDSDFSKATVGIFDKIDNSKALAFSLSKFVDLTKTLGEGFHSEDLEGHLWKLDTNESGSLDRFPFVRCYVDEDLSLNSAEAAEMLLIWGYKVSLMDL